MAAWETRSVTQTPTARRERSATSRVALHGGDKPLDSRDPECHPGMGRGGSITRDETPGREVPGLERAARRVTVRRSSVAEAT